MVYIVAVPSGVPGALKILPRYLMQKRRLGRTDLHVSAICLGTMTWGEQNSEADGHAQMDLAFERGVNFMDTAELYPIPPKPETQGRTETYVGNWMKARRTATRSSSPPRWSGARRARGFAATARRGWCAPTFSTRSTNR